MSLFRTSLLRALFTAATLVSSVATASPVQIGERMTDARFIAVARCAGWEPVARQDGRVAALYAAETRRTPAVQDRARSVWAEADRVARRAARGGEPAVAQLRIRFDRECSGLVPVRQP